jgi:hypothetical protein
MENNGVSIREEKKSYRVILVILIITYFIGWAGKFRLGLGSLPVYGPILVWHIEL